MQQLNEIVMEQCQKLKMFYQEANFNGKHHLIVVAKNDEQIQYSLKWIFKYYHLYQSHSSFLPIDTICPEDKIVVGFDCEFDRFANLAQIQMSVSSFTIIIRSHLFQSLPRCLIEFLESKTILKLGVSVHNDGLLISLAYPHQFIKMDGIVDLFVITKDLKEGDAVKGLEGLAARYSIPVRDFNLGKIDVRWQTDKIAEINYSAQDSWLGYVIGEQILSVKGQKEFFDEMSKRIMSEFECRKAYKFVMKKKDDLELDSLDKTEE